MAIIPPRIRPSRILLVPPMPESPAFSAVLMPPIIGSTMKFIARPMIRIPKTGYRRTGAIFSRAGGSLLHSLRRPIMI